MGSEVVEIESGGRTCAKSSGDDSWSQAPFDESFDEAMLRCVMLADFCGNSTVVGCEGGAGVER